MKGGEGWPWVAASGVENIESLTVSGLKPGTYRVHLTFANPSAEERIFDIRLQGQVVAPAFTSGQPMIGALRTFETEAPAGQLRIDLAAHQGSTHLSGLEILSLETLR